MKKTLCKFGGLIIFYTIIVVGVLLLNLRFSYLNNNPEISFNYETMN